MEKKLRNKVVDYIQKVRSMRARRLEPLFL